MTKTQIVELAKVVLRTTVIAVIFYLATGGVDIFLQAYGSSLSPEQRLLWSGLLTLIFKSLDEKMHSLGKKEEAETGKESKLTKGITRF